MGNAATTRKKIQNIETLRAVAALIVVAIHLEPLFNRLGIGVPNGGVDLFFVISGFIMIVIARDEKPKSFLWRRVARIVPLYWALTMFTFGAALMLPAFFQNTSADLLDLFRSLLFVPFVKGNAAIPQPILFVGWTLNYEAFFYALFAIGLAFGRRGIWFPILSILALVISGITFELTSPIMAFYTAPILLEFLFGIGVGAFYLYSKPMPVAVAIPIFAVSLFVMLYGDRFFELNRAFIAGIPAAFFLASTLTFEGRDWTLPDYKLGGASYAIYLTHPFLTSFALIVAARLPQTPIVTIGIILGTGVAVCFTGVMIFYGFERPSTRWLTKVGYRDRSTPIVPQQGRPA